MHPGELVNGTYTCCGFTPELHILVRYGVALRDMVSYASPQLDDPLGCLCLDHSSSENSSSSSSVAMDEIALLVYADKVDFDRLAIPAQAIVQRDIEASLHKAAQKEYAPLKLPIAYGEPDHVTKDVNAAIAMGVRENLYSIDFQRSVMTQRREDADKFYNSVRINLQNIATQTRTLLATNGATSAAVLNERLKHTTEALLQFELNRPHLAVGMYWEHLAPPNNVPKAYVAYVRRAAKTRDAGTIGRQTMINDAAREKKML